MGTGSPAHSPNVADMAAHDRYKSRFRELFSLVQQQNVIKEEHFFAFAFAAFSCSQTKPNKRELRDCQNKLLHILDYLTSKSGHKWRLSPLIGYILFLLRRFDIFHFAKGSWTPGMNKSYQLYKAGRNFPIPAEVTDKRLLWGSLSWIQTLQTVGRTECRGLALRCKDDVHALWSAFNIYMSSSDTHSQVREILYSVGMNISAMENHPGMITWFQEVSSSLTTQLT
jgi:hypothetical protein